MSDIAIAVREGADAVMLSGETAYGRFPFKAVSVMASVALRTERAMLRFSVRPFLSVHPPHAVPSGPQRKPAAWAAFGACRLRCRRHRTLQGRAMGSLHCYGQAR